MATPLNTPNPLESNLNLVFVDQGIENYQALLDGMVSNTPGTQLTPIVLEETQDGIEQITEVLAQYGDDQISAIHIVSHGDAGSVFLGNSVLNSNTLGDYQDQLQAWGDVLTNDGDLLFYGCKVGQGEIGQGFVDQLTGITGADIAASEDLTGSAALGGDWDFEVETGGIEGQIVFDLETQNSFQGVLIDIQDNSNQWGKTVNDKTVNLSQVKSTLTFKPQNSGAISVTRSSGNPNTLTIQQNAATIDVTGSGKNNNPKDKLDLSSITQDVEILVKKDQFLLVTVKNNSSTNKTFTFKSIKDVIGGQGNNTYTFEDGAKLAGALTGGAANQQNNKVNEIVYLGNNNQTINYTSANGGTATTLLSNGFTKINKITGGSGKETITGNASADIFLGGKGNDSLSGKAQNDSLVGGEGKDTLEGEAGNDTLEGGLGDDLYQYSANESNWGIDTIVEDSTNKGGDDSIDMSALTDDVMVEIGDQTFSVFKLINKQKDANNKLENIAFVETYKSTQGNNTYTVQNDWKGQLIIEDSGNGSIDLSAVDQRFLTLKIKGDNSSKDIVIEDGVGNTITVKNFKDVIGGKHYNRYEIDDENNAGSNILPFIKNPTNSANILDYENFNRNNEVFVNLDSFAVDTKLINLVNTQPGLVRVDEIRKIWTRAKQFTLKLGNKEKLINLTSTSYNLNPSDAFQTDVLSLLQEAVNINIQESDITVTGKGTEQDPFRIALSGKNFLDIWKVEDFSIKSGSSQANFIQETKLANNTEQSLYHTGVGGTFKLQYGSGNSTSNNTSGLIRFNGKSSLVPNRRSIANAIRNISAIKDVLDRTPTAKVEVKGSGTVSSPWEVKFTNFSIQVEKLQFLESEISLSSPGVNIEAVREQQQPIAAEWRLAKNDFNGGTFQLSYGNQTTASIAVNANAQTVETALQDLFPNDSATVDVKGNGTFNNPWIIKLEVFDPTAEIARLTINDSSVRGQSIAPESASGVANGQANTIVGTDSLQGEITQVIGSKINTPDQIDDQIFAQNNRTDPAVNISGGKGDDHIVGGQQADRLSGDAGDDFIQGEVKLAFDGQSLPPVSSSITFNLEDNDASNLSSFNLTIDGNPISQTGIDISGATNVSSLVDILNNNNDFNTDLEAEWSNGVLSIKQKNDSKPLSNPVLEIDELDPAVKNQLASNGVVSQVTLNNITDTQAGDLSILRLTIGGTQLEINVSTATDVSSLLTTLRNNQDFKDQKLAVNWNNNQLTIQDDSIAAFTNVSVSKNVPVAPTISNTAKPGTVVFDVTNAQAQNAEQFQITIDTVPLTLNVANATNGADLANKINSNTQNLVANWQNNKLTIQDSGLRNLSDESLTTSEFLPPTGTTPGVGNRAIFTIPQNNTPTYNTFRISVNGTIVAVSNFQTDSGNQIANILNGNTSFQNNGLTATWNGNNNQLVVEYDFDITGLSSPVLLDNLNGTTQGNINTGQASQVTFNLSNALNQLTNGNLENFKITINGTQVTVPLGANVTTGVSLANTLNNFNSFSTNNLTANWNNNTLTITDGLNFGTFTSGELNLLELDLSPIITVGEKSKITFNQVSDAIAQNLSTFRLTLEQNGNTTNLSPIDLSSVTDRDNLVSTLNNNTSFQAANLTASLGNNSELLIEHDGFVNVSNIVLNQDERINGIPTAGTGSTIDISVPANSTDFSQLTQFSLKVDQTTLTVDLSNSNLTTGNSLASALNADTGFANRGLTANWSNNQLTLTLNGVQLLSEPSLKTSATIQANIDPGTPARTSFDVTNDQAKQIAELILTATQSNNATQIRVSDLTATTGAALASAIQTKINQQNLGLNSAFKINVTWNNNQLEITADPSVDLTDAILQTQGGDDQIQGGKDNDTLLGGDGNDSIDGGADNDFIFGGDDGDTLLGGTGNDRIEGELGDDNILGGSDNDTIIGNQGNDILDGGTGNDTYTYQNGWGHDVIREITPQETYKVIDSGNANQNEIKDAELAQATGRVIRNTLDFAAVTESLTHVLSDNVLVSGTGIASSKVTFGGITDTAAMDATTFSMKVDNTDIKFDVTNAKTAEDLVAKINQDRAVKYAGLTASLEGNNLIVSHNSSVVNFSSASLRNSNNSQIGENPDIQNGNPGLETPQQTLSGLTISSGLAAFKLGLASGQTAQGRFVPVTGTTEEKSAANATLLSNYYSSSTLTEDLKQRLILDRGDGKKEYEITIQASLTGNQNKLKNAIESALKTAKLVTKGVPASTSTDLTTAVNGGMTVTVNGTGNSKQIQLTLNSKQDAITNPLEQTIKLSKDSSEDSFTLIYNGKQTKALNGQSTQSEVKRALDNITGAQIADIKFDNINSSASSADWIITFKDSAKNVSELELGTSRLTTLTNPSIQISASEWITPASLQIVSPQFDNSVLVGEQDPQRSGLNTTNGSLRNLGTIVAANADNTFIFGDNWGTDERAIRSATALSNKNQVLVIDTKLASQLGRNLTFDFRGVSKELEFVFRTTEVTDGNDNDQYKTLIISKVAQLDIPIAGTTLADIGYNQIVITHIDENTTIYGGRNENTYVVEETALPYGGKLIGGVGNRPLLADGVTGVISGINDLISGGTLPPRKVINTLDISGRSKTRTSGSLQDIGEELTSARLDSIGLKNLGINPISRDDDISIRGLTGEVKYLQNVEYGRGLNVITGSGINSESDFGKFNVINRSYGRNKFSVGTGFIESALSPFSNQGVSKKAAGDAAIDLLVGDIGLHLVGGGAGSDTYAFDGKWGIAAILEPPAITLGSSEDGVGALPEFFDTLDLGKVTANQYINIFDLNATTSDGLEALMYKLSPNFKFSVDIEIGIGTNLVMVTPFDFAELVRTGDIAADFNNVASVFETIIQSGLNPAGSGGIILANDIENIIGGRGVNEVTLWGNTQVQGTISASPGGQIVLDYAAFNTSDLSKKNVATENDNENKSTAVLKLKAEAKETATDVTDLKLRVEQLALSEFSLSVNGTTTVTVNIAQVRTGDELVSLLNNATNFKNADLVASWNSSTDELTVTSSSGATLANAQLKGSNGIEVNSGGGADFGLQLGKEWGETGFAPAIKYTIGSATGVQGNRFLNLTELIDAIAVWVGGEELLGQAIESYAVSSVGRVVGTTGDDKYFGSDREGDIFVGLGGSDYIDGGGGVTALGDPNPDDTFSLAGTSQPAIIDLNNDIVLQTNSQVSDSVLTDLWSAAFDSNSNTPIFTAIETINNLDLNSIFNDNSELDYSVIKDIENIAVGEGNELIIGDSSDGNKYFLKNNWGVDLIIDTSAKKNIIDTEQVVKDAAKIYQGNNVLVLEKNNNLLIAVGNFEVKDSALDDFSFIKTFLPLSRGAGGPQNLETTSGSSQSTDPLTSMQLEETVQEALNRWSQSALIEVSPIDLESITYEIVDLPGTIVGQTVSSNKILIDIDAAGRGWFVDQTPEDNAEFALIDGAWIANPGGDAEGEIDLLTTVMHEMGHVLGFPHSDMPNHLMQEQIDTGQRFDIPVWNEGDPIPLISDLDIMEAVSDETKLKDGLTAFANWSSNFGATISDITAGIPDIPFLGSELNLNNLWNATGTQVTDAINTGITNLVSDVFANKPAGQDVTTEDILALPNVTQGVVSNQKEFTVTIDVTTYDQEVTLDNRIFNGLGIDLPLNLQASEPFRLMAQLDVALTFGLDDNNQFFVSDPTLIGEVDLGTENPFDLSAGIGPLGIGIDDGILDLFVRVTAGTDGILTFDNQGNEASGLLIGTPNLGGDARFDVNLPIVLQGALAGLQDSPGLIAASYNSLDDGAAESASLSDFFSALTANLSPSNLDEFLNLKEVSLDSLLDGVEQGLDALVQPDGPAFDKIPGVNQSLVDLFGQGTTNFVDGIKTAVSSVRTGLENVQQLERDINFSLDNALSLNQDFGGTQAEITSAYNDLVSIAFDLDGSATDLEIAEDLVGEATLSARVEDLLVAIAASNLSALGLTKDASDLQIAQALFNPERQARYDQLILDRDLLASDTSGFTTALADLQLIGLTVNATDADIAAALDNQTEIDEAKIAVGVLNEPASDDFAKSVSRALLASKALDETSTDADIIAAYDNAAAIAAAQQALQTIQNGSPALQAAAGNLSAFGLSETADNPTLAIALVDSDQIEDLREDRRLLNTATNDTTTALANLAAIGITTPETASTETIAIAIAETNFTQPFLEAKADRDLLREFDAKKVIGLGYEEDILTFELQFEELDIETLQAFDLDLQDLLNQPGIPDEIKALIGEATSLGVDASSSGELFLDVLLQDVKLGIDVDVSDVLNPDIYIHDDTRITFDVVINTPSPLDFEASIPIPSFEEGLTLRVEDGLVDIDVVGALAFAESETGRYLLSGFDNSNLDLAIDGVVNVDLPLFFPTADTPMGGSLGDGDGDGIADNVLHIDADFEDDGLSNLEVAIPDLISAGQLFTFLNDPDNIIKGLEGTFDTLDAGLKAALDIPLPVIGNLKNEIGNQINFFQDIKTELVGTADQPSGLRKSLQAPTLTLATLTQGSATVQEVQTITTDGTAGSFQFSFGPQSTVLLDSTATATDIQTALSAIVTGGVTVSGSGTQANPWTVTFNTLGDKADIKQDKKTTIEILQLEIFNSSLGTLLTLEDINNDNVINALDIPLTLEDDNIQFDLPISGSLGSFALPIDFDAAVPGFSLEIDPGSTLNLDLMFDFQLGFGFSSADGFYVDTTGALDTGEELAIRLEATLSDNFKATGQLGFLKVQVDEIDKGSALDNDQKNSGFFGQLGLDLRDPSGDGRLSVSELPAALANPTESLVGTLRADANLDLTAFVDVPSGGAVSLPQISTIIRYDQVFANASTAGSDTTSLFESPTVVFENVELDLGKFISDIIGPVASTVDPFLDPVVDLAKFLTTPIIDTDVITLRLFDLARVTMDPIAFAAADSALKALVGFGNFVDLVNKSKGESILINFGDFTLGNNLLSDPNAAVTAADVAGSNSPDLAQAADGNAQNESTKGLVREIGTTPGSIEFPILTDPTAVLGLLSGKNATLFRYDMPDLNVNFELKQDFPIFPGLNGFLRGDVSFMTDFSFGFDSQGIQSWAEGGFLLPDITQILDGFFVEDVVNGVDRDEVSFDLTVSAGAAVGISGLVEAGVEGGLTAGIDFDLNDLVDPITNQADGLLRINEIGQLLAEDPLCLFNVSGDLSVFLEAFLWVGARVLGANITLVEERERFVDELLASFEHNSCPPPIQADVAVLSGEELILRYLPDGVNAQPGNESVNYRVSLLTKDIVDNNQTVLWKAGETIEVIANGTREYFLLSDVSTISTTGSSLDALGMTTLV